MIRITTNSSLRMYRSNLMKSTNSLNSAMTKLMTQRQFSSYASNPAAATRAFKIHSSLNATNAQYSNNDTVLHMTVKDCLLRACVTGMPCMPDVLFLPVKVCRFLDRKSTRLNSSHT